MIYGDNPQKINEREDALGLKTYSYAPHLLSVLQSGNLYSYCISNPINYFDPTGELIWPGEIHQAVVNHLKKKYDLFSEQFILYSSPIEKRGKFYSIGRADLISPDGQVWEVKPDKKIHQIAGKKQLSNYVAGTWLTPETIAGDEPKKLSKGQELPSAKFSYISADGTKYDVSYRYEDGLILYKPDKHKARPQLQKASQPSSVMDSVMIISVITLGTISSVLLRDSR